MGPAMMGVPLRVTALWDEEASVWVATSTDLPGLVTEADGLDPLRAKLDILIPELLEASGALAPQEIPVEIVVAYPRGRAAGSGV